jgi:hypothetical protein
LLALLAGEAPTGIGEGLRINREVSRLWRKAPAGWEGSALAQGAFATIRKFPVIAAGGRIIRGSSMLAREDSSMPSPILLIFG